MTNLVVNTFREGVRQSPGIADMQNIQGFVHRVYDDPSCNTGFRVVVLDGFVGQVYAVPVNKEPCGGVGRIKRLEVAVAPDCVGLGLDFIDQSMEGSGFVSE